MGGFLIVNPRSGAGGPDVDELVVEAGRLGVEARVLREREDPAALARSAEADAVGVAGGDGSLAQVAAVAVERGLPFVCVPVGTRNHFARDVGLDRDDWRGALAAFGSRREQHVDVGRVDGRLFLNNVSFGVYARLVRRREEQRRRRDAFARLRALWLSVRERHPVGLVIDGEPVSARAVVVANNAYELDLFDVGERERLDEGVLHMYLAEGWLPNAWEERVATSVRVEAAAALRAAVDGEPVELESPAELRIEPGALRVLLPETG
jgi:diacylglycerol kinase family enzyme